MNSIVGDLPGKDATINRLLRNADDFAAAFQPFYGPTTAARFGELLKGHLTIATELVQALRTGNSAAAADAQRRWYINADDIAVFLGRINPYWSQEEWRQMMHQHLRLLTAEVAARVAGNYTENVSINDSVELQALEMVDVMPAELYNSFQIYSWDRSVSDSDLLVIHMSCYHMTSSVSGEVFMFEKGAI